MQQSEYLRRFSLVFSEKVRENNELNKTGVLKQIREMAATPFFCYEMIVFEVWLHPSINAKLISFFMLAEQAHRLFVEREELECRNDIQHDYSVQNDTQLPERSYLE